MCGEHAQTDLFESEKDRRSRWVGEVLYDQYSDLSGCCAGYKALRKAPAHRSTPCIPFSRSRLPLSTFTHVTRLVFLCSFDTSPLPAAIFLHLHILQVRCLHDPTLLDRLRATTNSLATHTKGSILHLSLIIDSARSKHGGTARHSKIQYRQSDLTVQLLLDNSGTLSTLF